MNGVKTLCNNFQKNMIFLQVVNPEGILTF